MYLSKGISITVFIGYPSHTLLMVPLLCTHIFVGISSTFSIPIAGSTIVTNKLIEVVVLHCIWIYDFHTEAFPEDYYSLFGWSFVPLLLDPIIHVWDLVESGDNMVQSSTMGLKWNALHCTPAVQCSDSHNAHWKLLCDVICFLFLCNFSLCREDNICYCLLVVLKTFN